MAGRVRVNHVNSRRTGGHHEVELEVSPGQTMGFRSKLGLPQPGRVTSLTRISALTAPEAAGNPAGTSPIKALGDSEASFEHDGKGLYVDIGEGPFEGHYYLAPSFGDGQFVVKNLSEPKIEKEAFPYDHPIVVGFGRGIGLIPPPPANPGQPMAGPGKSLLQEAKQLTLDAGKAFAIGAAGAAGAKLGWKWTPDRFKPSPTKQASEPESVTENAIEKQPPAELQDEDDILRPAIPAEAPLMTNEHFVPKRFEDS